MIRPELTPPPSPSGRSGIRSIPKIWHRRLPSIFIDDQPFPVDRVGLVYIGRQWAISDVPNPLQVGQAAEWLTEADPIITPTHGSYKLKHAAESWAGCYIGNGSLILAAHLLGFAIRRQRWDSPNVLIGVSTRWLRTRPEAWCMGLYHRERFPVANLDN